MNVNWAIIVRRSQTSQTNVIKIGLVCSNDDDKKLKFLLFIRCFIHNLWTFLDLSLIVLILIVRYDDVQCFPGQILIWYVFNSFRTRKRYLLLYTWARLVNLFALINSLREFSGINFIVFESVTKILGITELFWDFNSNYIFRLYIFIEGFFLIFTSIKNANYLAAECKYQEIWA